MLVNLFFLTLLASSKCNNDTHIKKKGEKEMMKTIDNTSLRKRMNKFLEDYYQPNPNEFLKDVGLEYSHYYRWINEQREFGQESQVKMDRFLTEKGY